MGIKIVDSSILLDELKQIAEGQFGDLVKAVLDIEKGIMAIGGDLHADEEAVLIENGSKQENLWGINIYPEKSGKERVEFDSMINIRPSQGNRSRNVEDSKIREKITEITSELITG